MVGGEYYKNNYQISSEIGDVTYFGILDTQPPNVACSRVIFSNKGKIVYYADIKKENGEVIHETLCSVFYGLISINNREYHKYEGPTVVESSTSAIENEHA